MLTRNYEDPGESLIGPSTEGALVESRRVGVVVTDTYRPSDHDNDTGPFIEALCRLGVPAEPIVWHHTEPQRAQRFSLLVIRSPWDYPQRPEEFRRWLSGVSRRVTVLNPPELVEWNLDKLYLRRLEDHGIHTVPTTWVHDRTALKAALDSHEGGWVVLKPSLSAGAQDTDLLRADSLDAVELGDRILSLNRTVMVQPEIAELSEGREKALYFIDGEHTHTIAKGALLARGGGFRGGQYREDPQPMWASEEEAAFGGRVMEAVTAETGLPMPLYARVDLVSSDAVGVMLLEAELFEPALNLHRVPGAAETLARATAARLEALPE